MKFSVMVYIRKAEQTQLHTITVSVFISNQMNADKEVMIDGFKIVVKASHREIYKGIPDVDSG